MSREPQEESVRACVCMRPCLSIVALQAADSGHRHHHHDHKEGPVAKRAKEDHHHHHHHTHDDHAHHDDCAACTHGEHKHNHEDHAHHDDCAACGHAEHKHNHDDHAHHDDCAACTHDHGHGHHHHHHEHNERPATRAAQRFGIKSFVYCRRRPFHPQRLKEMVLKWLPVRTNTAIENEAPELGDSPIKAGEMGDSECCYARLRSDDAHSV